METHPVDPGGCHALGGGSGMGFTLVLGIYGRLRTPRGAISPWSGLSLAYVVPGELSWGACPYATIHEEHSILACRHTPGRQLTTLVQLDLYGLLPAVGETPPVRHVVGKRELGVMATGGRTAGRHHAVVTLMPRRGRSRASRTTTRVLALLTWSNEGIFTVLDTLCLLWCVSRGTLSSRNCRHIRGSLFRHTFAPFPLRSRQVSTITGHGVGPCGVHYGRRSWHHSLLLDTWASTPSLAWGVDTSSGAC